MQDLILAIDQGTTGTTVLLLDTARTVRSRGYREFAQIYPRPGEVEHDPEAIWASVMPFGPHRPRQFDTTAS